MDLKLPFYVIGDTHWQHKNIVKYCGRPYDHERMMLKRWKRTIKDTDVVLHLGDLFFGSYDRFAEQIAPKLTGEKYIILGNHDKRKYDYEALGFTVVKPFSLKYRNYTVSFDHYPKLLPEWERRLHVHGHIHNNGYSQGEPFRHGNINVSVEVLDYRPHRATRLLNKEISKRNQKKGYYNSKGFRTAVASRSRRARA